MAARNVLTACLGFCLISTIFGACFQEKIMSEMTGKFLVSVQQYNDNSVNSVRFFFLFLSDINPSFIV